MQKQLAEEEAAASELGTGADDPFASLGDHDDQDNTDPFSLDEEEQDITSIGNRNKAYNNQPSGDDRSLSSVSRGITGLFSAGSAGNRDHEKRDGVEASPDDSSSSGSGSDAESDRPPLEAKTSNERRPLDIDEDEEMGEMVAPAEEGNSSDEAEYPSMERKRSRRHSRPEEEPVSEFAHQQDQSSSSDEEVVEINMPNPRRLSGTH